MPAVLHRATAAALLLLFPALLLDQRVSCHSLNSPPCPKEEGKTDAAGAVVCNAVLHYQDKVIDQGQYCNGCANCSGIAVPLDSPNSFAWQHFEHPELRVQFLTCGPLPRDRPRCDRVSSGAGDLAAVFVTPQFYWSPRLRDLHCTCPNMWGTPRVPLYHLRSWSLQGSQWVYEFVCPTDQCRVPSPQQPGRQQQQQQASTSTAHSRNIPSASPTPLSSVPCAEKRQSEPRGPVAVTFKCTCPPGYHCVIHDVVLKSDESTGKPGGGGGGGGGVAGGGGDGAGGKGADGGDTSGWEPLVVKHCQRVVMAGANGTEEAAAGRKH